MNRMREMSGNIMLFIAAFIWGTAFVAQSVALDYIGPFTINASRSLIGSAALVPVAILFGKKAEKNGTDRPSSPFGRWTLAVGGLFCGLVLFVAANLQQLGLAYTSVGKAGFITSLYIVLVPVLGLLLGHRPHPVLWICVGIACVGLYLLSMAGMEAINRGDILVLLCALAFAVHIQVVDYFAPRVNGVALSCVQFLIAGILSSVCMFLFETPHWTDLFHAAGPILYTGILSSGVAYTLQILGQERTNPVTGSLLMSLESVWSVVGGFIILHQTLTGRELLGCLMMMIALVLSQLPIPQIMEKFRKSRSRNG